MGVYDTLEIEDGIELPKFPPDRRPGEIEWQTKAIGMPYMQAYKLTADGRLLRHEEDLREKTPSEKQAEAESNGFDSWDSYVSFCETAAPNELLERGLGLGLPRSQTVADEYWLDHTMHGSFEFHGSRDDIEDGMLWSYEARFTTGDLDAIVFLGHRGGGEAAAFKPDQPTIIRY